MTRPVDKKSGRVARKQKPSTNGRTRQPVVLTADALTVAKIEALMLRDGLGPEAFLARATEAYALVLPGWPYPAS